MGAPTYRGPPVRRPGRAFRARQRAPRTAFEARPEEPMSDATRGGGARRPRRGTGWGTGSPCARCSPYDEDAGGVDPFLLLDYAAPDARSRRPTRPPRRRRAPAPRLRDRDDRLPGRGRAPRLRRQPRPHRPGRRPVDDRRRRASSTRSSTAREFARTRRPLRDGPALGEPARERQDARRRATRTLAREAASPTSRSPDGAAPCA